MTKNIYLSVVAPCYNEISRGNPLEENVKRTLQILKKNYNDSFELILFDDKSKDSTKQAIQKLAKKHKNVIALFHEINKGRGKTVSDGIIASKGKYSGFIDIDLETDAKYIPIIVSKLEQGYDVSTAWRHTKAGWQHIARDIASNAYRNLAKVTLGTSFNDTETGFKFFNKKKIIPVLKKTKNEGWFWDTEIMARAHYADLKVIETPVQFIKKQEIQSTVRFFNDIKDYARELIKFKMQILKESKLK